MSYHFYLSISYNSFTVHEVDWDWYLTNSEIPVWCFSPSIWPIFQGLSCGWCQQWRTGFPGECHFGPNLPRYREGKVVWVIGPLQVWEGSFEDLIKSSNDWRSFTFAWERDHDHHMFFRQTTSVTSNIKWFTSLDETSRNKLIHIISFQNSMSSEIHNKWCAKVDINPQMFEVPLCYKLALGLECCNTQLGVMASRHSHYFFVGFKR